MSRTRPWGCGSLVRERVCIAYEALGLCEPGKGVKVHHVRGPGPLVSLVLLFSVPLEHVCPFRAPRRVRCSAIRTVKVVGINAARSVRSALRSALRAAFIPTTLQYSTDRGTPNAARSAERTDMFQRNGK